MDLLHKSLSSIKWHAISNVTKNVVLLMRSIILARLLPVEIFGVYGLALSVVSVSIRVSNFGMDGAFINRSPETEDIQKAASVHFLLISVFTIFWAVLMILGSYFFSKGDLFYALLTLTIIFGFLQLTETPKLILRRKVIHKRLAIINIIDVIFGSVSAIILASHNYRLLSLLSINFFNLVISGIALYIYKPVWKVNLSWSIKTVKYYLNFGYRSFLGGILYEAIDRIDDIWTGIFLGDLSLGYYSRAYSFANYPSKLLADPINRVALGYYADLKNSKEKLSRAFLYSNGVLIRGGFLFGGLLALIAPEFIVLLIGNKWMPMLHIFRLMLVYTLLNPLKITTSHLFVGVGKPIEMVRARTLQLVFMIFSLFLFGSIWDAEGVAIAVNLTILLGLGYMFYKSKQYVNVSLKKLFLAPVISLIVGLIASTSVYLLGFRNEINFLTGLVKSVTFSVFYTIVIVLLEKGFIVNLFNLFIRRNR